jgi:Bacterial Ig-like domain (group 3)
MLKWAGRRWPEALVLVLTVAAAAVGSWVASSSMPTAGASLAAALGPDGWVYARGGQSSSGAALETAEVFTARPMTNTTLQSSSSSASLGQHSRSETLRQVVQTATSTRIASSRSSSMVGQQVTFTATVTPLPDGGTVSFTDRWGGAWREACKAPISPAGSGSGTATCTIAFSITGTHEVTATFSGTPTFAGSFSLILAHDVLPAVTATTLTSSANPSTIGQQVTFTAAVTPLPDGGTVAFSDGGSRIQACEAQSISPAGSGSGTATCTTTFSTPGTYQIVASFSGTSNFIGSQSDTLSQDVHQATTTTITSSRNPSSVGQQVTFTATVMPHPGGGGVAFSDNGRSISGCDLQPIDPTSGTATCTTADLTAGSHQIVASFSGSKNLDASRSPVLDQVVEAAPGPTPGLPNTGLAGQEPTPRGLPILAVLLTVLSVAG